MRKTSLSRRDAIRQLGMLGTASMLGCDSSPTSPNGTPGVGCVVIPQETEGPYPLYSVLQDPLLRRRDVTDGRTGVPLTLRLALVNVNSSCAPISGAGIYIWQCDKDGQYSGYSGSGNGNNSGQTFLRGVQVTDAQGVVTFDTIYPGWYQGRITHIHFDVYLGNDLGVRAKATSQIAFPQSVTTAVYNSELYRARGQNTSVSGFAVDNVFRDGTEFQLATVTGSVETGYTATLTVGVAA